MPPYIPNQKISGMYTVLLQLLAHTFPLQLDSEMFTVSINQAMSISILNSSANTKPLPRNSSKAKMRNLCRFFFIPANDSFLVFHGGSGSTKEEYNKAISFGVVKVNLDTDLQFAYCSGIRDYMLGKKDYLMKQVGNPDGEDKPNKKYFDPRVWVREGEKTMSKCVSEGLNDFKTAGKA